MFRTIWLLPFAAAATGLGPPAAAQGIPAAPAPRADAQTDERAVEQAEDAFGIRVGVEQIGLYSETQVRGFNLQDSGNYRLSGAYFAKSANFVDPVLAGVVTQVGINALDADFPAPSGVVDYRLRSSFDAPRLHLELALRDYGGRFVELGGALRSADGRAAVSLGVQGDFAGTSTGLFVDYYRLGTVAEWRPEAGSSVIGFASLNIFDLRGFYGIATTQDALPPRMVHPGRYLPDWSDHDGRDINAGLIATTGAGETVEARASIVHSRLELDRADYIHYALDGDGIGRATGISNRPRLNRSWSGAASIGWRHAPGHRLFGELRVRHTRSAFAPAVSVDLGRFDLAEGLHAFDAPHLPPHARSFDTTRQATLGIGYEATIDRLRLKGGVQRTFHHRAIALPALGEEAREQGQWLYDASAVLRLGGGWTGFASATRGLEESGVAPAQAANGYDVLPVAIATQQELGVRAPLGAGLTAIGSLFRIAKSAPGFDAANVYRLIGTLRHQGAELSLTGSPLPGIRLVAGAVYLDASRAGAPVDAGLWSREPAGIPRLHMMAGLTLAAPGIAGLSFDGQVNHSTSRRVGSRGALRTPALTTVDLGLRYAFAVGGTDLTLRARVTNLFDTDSWVAQRNETLGRPGRRGGRLSLSARF